MLMLLSLLAVTEPVIPITNVDGKTTASGVLLNKFTVLTVAHAVGEQREVVFVRCGDDDIAGSVVRKDVIGDMALIRLYQECTEVQSLSLADKAPIPNDNVEIAGYPAGALKHAHAKVRHYKLFPVANRLGYFWIALVFDGVVRPGNSGGPVINQFGKLVGIVHGYDENSPGRPGVAIPLNAIINFLRDQNHASFSDSRHH